MSFIRLKNMGFYKNNEIFMKIIEIYDIITRGSPGAYIMYVYVIYIFMLRHNYCITCIGYSYPIYLVPYDLIDPQGAGATPAAKLRDRKVEVLERKVLKEKSLDDGATGRIANTYLACGSTSYKTLTFSALNEEVQESYKKFMVFRVGQTENHES